MKKTINANIGSVAFILDENAYYMLQRYLEDIDACLEPQEAKETINDVEMRIADIFSENINSSNQVVNTELVRKVIAIIGHADQFGGPCKRKRRTFFEEHARKLRRSNTNRVLGGVCSGIAKYFGIDTSLVRLTAFILIFFGGISVGLYILLWFVIPSEL